MSKNSTIITAVVVVLIAIVGVAIFASMSKKDETKKDNNNTSMTEQTVMVGGAAMYPSKNIIQNVTNASNLTTLVTAVKAADLVDALSGTGPFTVFGPNNDAFAALPTGTVEEVLKPENKALLQSVLKYHVVSGKYLISDLSDKQQLITLQGQVLTVSKKDGKTLINDAEVETSDVLQSNGVAHVIKKVLLPDTNPTVGGMAMYRTKNLIENVTTAPNLTTLVAAVKAGGLVESLQTPGPITVFGPDNDAFAKLPAGTVETLLKPENLTTLQGYLKYHVVAGKYLTADLKDGQELTTLNGQKLTVIKKDRKVQIKSTSGNIATINTADVVQSNGVAHVIDSVLLPTAN